MEKVFFTTVSILLALCPAESQSLVVTGDVGGKVDIKCSHILASTNNKYFCRQSCTSEDILIQTRDINTYVEKGKYSISDFRDGSFTVTIKDLNKSDSGTYWCGVDRLIKDTFTEVYLRVKDARVSVTPGSLRVSKTQPPNTSSMPDTNECQIDRLCGEGGTCHNLIGSYWCQCSDGFNNYGNNQTKCVELSCDHLKKQPGQTLTGFDNLLTLMEDNCLMLRNSSSSEPNRVMWTGDVLLNALVNATDVVQLGLQDSAGQLNSSDVTFFLRTVENSLRLIGPQLTVNFTRIRTDSTEAEILVNRDRTQPTGPVSLTNENAQLDTSWETVVGDEQNYPGFAFVLLLSYKTLSSLNVSSSLQRQQLMSSVATVSISNPNSENLLQPVKLTLSHLQSSGTDLYCVYWSEEDGLGAWSGRGCTTVMSNSTHTICSCNHLSSFAVIQELQQQKERNGFSSVTWVCLLLALACVVISLITTIWCRFLSRKRHRGNSQQSAQFQTK